MKNIRILRALATGLLLGLASGCAHQSDPYLWLEQVESSDALAWVKVQNEGTLKVLEQRPNYPWIEKSVRDIVLATDRIPAPKFRNGYVYNFWQDQSHTRGVWRRTKLSQYSEYAPKWETILDVDKLAAVEHENWVWKHVECLPPNYDRCIVQLSRGGKDAAVAREFDVTNRRFIPAAEGGFEIPEAKSELTWVDRDRLLVATDFGPGTLTAAGYPRQVKYWHRGERVEMAKLVHEVPVSYEEASGSAFFSLKENVFLLVGGKSFFEQELWLFNPTTAEKTRLDLPIDARVSGFSEGRLILVLRSDWKREAGYSFMNGSLKGPWNLTKDMMAGAVVAVDLRAGTVEQVWTPDERSAVRAIETTRDGLLVNILENVKGKILRFTREKEGWKAVTLSLPGDGTLGIESADPFSSVVLTSYESFLVPTTIYSNGRPIKRLPARFDTRGLLVEQLGVTSRDGTKVPYFVVRSKAFKYDGNAPVLLYAYGGFEIPMLPQYGAVTGKVWLERGGVYVLANIRGGGEFGPRWHQAVIKQNRQKAFDDFIAVADDLVQRKVTRPARLGIMGGSNGGLLVGATFTQRPELFGAVVCMVPLLDMVRYSQLLAGHSWIGEYGDPADPTLLPSILAYSPYQNVFPAKRYPEVFFITSTKDDRVHPGHARKMVAKMEGLGYPVYYFENTEGGHGAAANLEQRVKMYSLEYAYLSMQLGVK